jgi:hypothetical protein
LMAANRRFGSLATEEVEAARSCMSASPPKADKHRIVSECPLSAKTGCEQSQQAAPYSSAQSQPCRDD